MDCAAPNWPLVIGSGLGLLACGIFIGICIAALFQNPGDPQPQD